MTSAGLRPASRFLSASERVVSASTVPRAAEEPCESAREDPRPPTMRISATEVAMVIDLMGTGLLDLMVASTTLGSVSGMQLEV